jgi:hypothetical protein
MRRIQMSLNLRLPTPYKKKGGDQITMLPPTHYVTLFFGVETGRSEKGRIMYDTQRLYVGNGGVYTSEQDRVSMDDIETKYPWFWTEYRKITPELRREVRLILPEERIEQAADLPDEFLTTFETLPDAVRQQLLEQYSKAGATQQVPVLDENKLWHCDDCDVDIANTGRMGHYGSKVHKENSKKRGGEI